MKPEWQQFLEQNLSFSGLAAWGARLPDRALASHCHTTWFGKPQIERILSRLLLAAESLAQHRLQPQRLCWTFEHARICAALRPDGACLALFLENRPDLPRPALEAALEGFRRLP